MRGDIPELLKSIGSSGADLILRTVFPPTCAGCGVSSTWMCAACRQRIITLDSTRVAGPSIGTPGNGSIPVVARFVFAEPVRHAIHLLKYQGERARSEWFAAELQSLVKPYLNDDALLAPVPLTARRERTRGYNQSAEIAQRVSKSIGARCDPRALRRIRETQPQVELTGLERIHNVLGAFEATRPLDERVVILVDDVVTTGATLRECAAACYAAGATAVVGVAAASGQPARRVATSERW